MVASIVGRGGKISLSGVGEMKDPLSMMTSTSPAADVQANVKRWTDDILPLALDDEAHSASPPSIRK